MNKTLMAAVGTLFVLAVGSAHAGFKIPWGVTVDTTNRVADGTAMGARAAPDSMSFVGCSVMSFQTGSPVAMCTARNSAGVTGGCSSSVPSIVQAAESGGPNSYYYFVWDQYGMCTLVSVDNGSYSGPLQP